LARSFNANMQRGGKSMGAGVFSPTHTRTEGPTPVWGSELIGLTSAKQGRFLEVCKPAKCAPILDLRPGRYLEEHRASAGGLSCDQISQSSLREA
jgi:hypothetical protein